jgi:hypothetical protein
VQAGQASSLSRVDFQPVAVARFAIQRGSLGKDRQPDAVIDAAPAPRFGAPDEQPQHVFAVGGQRTLPLKRIGIVAAEQVVVAAGLAGRIEPDDQPVDTPGAYLQLKRLPLAGAQRVLFRVPSRELSLQNDGRGSGLEMDRFGMLRRRRRERGHQPDQEPRCPDEQRGRDAGAGGDSEHAQLLHWRLASDRECAVTLTMHPARSPTGSGSVR